MSGSGEFDEDWANVKRPYARYALGVGLATFAAVGVALILQHVSEMEPCAWCTLQRLLFIVMGVLSVGVWLTANNPGPARALAALAVITGIAGVAAAMWQHLVAAASNSCAMTLADKIISATYLDQLMPWMFQARAMCDEANVPFLGVPFALWSAILFVGFTLVMLIVTFAKGSMK
ncbi:MAG: disulfide bond formation protein B [Burkholderiaceae bacterium]